MAARDFVASICTAVSFALLGGCSEGGDSSSGDESQAAPSVTEEPVDVPTAPEGADLGPGGMSECVDASGDVFIDQEPGSAPNQGFLDLTRVEVDDRGTDIEVRWYLATPAPARASLADGSDGSNLWTINAVAPGDTLGYSLEVTQIGEGWDVVIVDFEQSAETTRVSEPEDARIGAGDVIVGTFPSDSMTRLTAGTGWFALTEGDGDPDPEFDFILPVAVQDRCPDAPVPLDTEPAIALR